MHPVAVEPTALPGAALPLLDLAASVQVPTLPDAVGGPLGAALEDFRRAWKREGDDLARAGCEQAGAVMRAAELYSQLEATLVLGRLR